MRNDRFNIRAVLMLMVCLLVTATAVLAQSDTSSISGTVTDTSGALVPGAQITIHNNATLADRTITIDAGRTLILDGDTFIDAANAAGIVVIGRTVS